MYITKTYYFPFFNQIFSTGATNGTNCVQLRRTNRFERSVLMAPRDATGSPGVKGCPGNFLLLVTIDLTVGATRGQQ